MKKTGKLKGYQILFIIVILHKSLFSQIIISSDELPTTVGTIITTEDDTVAGVTVNVGSPGENQVWQINQTFDGILSYQEIVQREVTPFAMDFQTANTVTRYTGKLGDLIYSVYFNDMSGDFYSYQNASATRFLIQGIGVESSSFNGPVDIQPDVLFYSLPLEYGKSWQSVSQFTIEIDTVFFGLPTKLIAHIKDSLFCEVDGWGKLILPEAGFDCLRLKSYITLDEKLYVSGSLFKSSISRTINYSWLAENYGVVARIISQLDEPNDNFTSASLVSRLTAFNDNSVVRSKDNRKLDGFCLHSCYPNPFNSATLISYHLPQSGRVTLNIYNTLGQLVFSLVDAFQSPGDYEIIWNGQNLSGSFLPSGIYLCVLNLESAGVNLTKINKISLIK